MALMVAVTAGGIAASAVVAVGWRRAAASPLHRLATAVGPHRVTRARLTGGFAYASCDTAVPNDSLVAGLICDRVRPNQWAQSGELSRLADELRSSGVAVSSAPVDLHRMGGWDLVWGDIDAAIEKLRRAAEAEPRNARVRSDLAAALLARAQREQDPRSIVEAYVAVDSALALEPDLREALFNRAVALEWLYLRGDAIAAWSAFLQRDGRSPWAAEAREHSRRLNVSPPAWPAAKKSLDAAVAADNPGVVRTITREFPAQIRSETRRLVIEWGKAYEARAPRADTLLAAAAVLARSLAATTGDSLWADAVGSLTYARTPRARAQRDAVARGLIAYDRGDTYLNRLSLDSAESSFRESHQLLHDGGNAAQYWAAFGIAAVAYSRQTPGSYLNALPILRDLRTTTPNAYRVVRGFAARTEGVIEGIGANFGAAVAAYSAAISEGRGTGDPSLELRPHANLGLNYANLGDDNAAWRHVYDALRSSPRFADASREMQRVFMRAAALSADRSARLASLFQNEVILLASKTSTTATDSMVMIAALRRQAELLGREGLTDQALESVRKARAYIATIQADSIRALSAADMDLAEAQAWLVTRPDRVVQELTRVVQRYRDTQYFRQVARAELLLANAYAATGAMDLAQHSFESALAEVERRRSNITGAEERARFLDQARPLIDTLVKFLADRGKAVRALEFLEQMRGRVLLERIQEESIGAASPDTSVDAIRRHLTPGTSIISYAVLKDEIVAWLIRLDGVSIYRTPVPPGLADLTRRFSTLMALRSSDTEARATAIELHQLLIAPLVAELRTTTRLIVVPDKSLHFVPFAALFDSTRNQYLIERFEINVAPSVQLYVQSAARYSQLRQVAFREVLTVGDPSFDERLFSFPRLPGADREARRVASLYDRARVLVGTQATKAAFLEAAANSEMIHFAGHGVVRSDAPLLSYLLLAPGDSGKMSGVLTARELFAQRLPTTRLAILSGCQTAGGRVSDTEGTSSLARALFGAGVPAVLASLWNVDDESTAEFFAEYHQRVAQGEDPSTALRRVQLHWLGRDEGGWIRASTWAAFTLFGTTGPAPDEPK